MNSVGQREDSAWEQFVQPLSQSIKDENCRPRSGSMLHHGDEKRISEVLYFEIIIPFFLSLIKILRAWRKSTHYSPLSCHLDPTCLYTRTSERWYSCVYTHLLIPHNNVKTHAQHNVSHEIWRFCLLRNHKKEAKLYSASFKLDIEGTVIQTYALLRLIFFPSQSDFIIFILHLVEDVTQQKHTFKGHRYPQQRRCDGHIVSLFDWGLVSAWW